MASKAHIKCIPERNSVDNESELRNRYPNLVYFKEKNCDDCDKRCEIPSMEVFACMFEKLSNKKNRGNMEA